MGNWREESSLALYGALTVLAKPLLRRKLRRRGQKEAGYLEDVDQRFGLYSPSLLKELTQHRGQPRIWLHAVSLGETRAAGLLVNALRSRWPGMQLVLTCSTATGREEGRRYLRDGDVQIWLPWDTRDAVRRFLKAVQPDLGLLMETEIWPNLQREADSFGVPMALVNARLNEKSTHAALRWPALMKPAYGRLALALAQTQDDAGRLGKVGVKTVRVRGNIKYDARPDATQLAQAEVWRKPLTQRGLRIALLASSRADEEAALLDALAETLNSSLESRGVEPASVQWMIVPRHPQRFDEIAELAASKGWTVRRRCDWGNAGPLTEPPHSGRELWLGDSMGEMSLYYGLADVALLGGSFEPLGGQNLIEAAACGCPVIMGPHTFNFAQASEQAEQAGAARRVADLKAAVSDAQALLADTDPHRLVAMREATARFVAESRGAVQATVEDLAGLLRK